MTGLLRSTFALFAVLALAGAAAAPAMAQGTDQYEVDIPGPGGGGPSGDADDEGAGDTSEGVPLTPQQTDALDDYGVEGEGVAEVADETSGDRDQESNDAASASAGSSDSGGPSGSSGELAADTDSGGSALLPILLISAVAAAVGFFVARKRGWPARQA